VHLRGILTSVGFRCDTRVTVRVVIVVSTARHAGVAGNG
jgi:hypothetical protein